MPAEPKEPRTDAGKALLEWWKNDPKELALVEDVTAAILAIEEQAAAEARRELLVKVEALPDPLNGHPLNGHPLYGNVVDRAAVLRLIEDATR